MSVVSIALICCLSLRLESVSVAQIVISPQVRSKVSDGRVTVVDLAAHFVSAIRLPDAVNSIAVGDTAMFQVEHSEREPELVLIKTLTEKDAQTNVIISTLHRGEFTLLLVNHGNIPKPKVDFLLQYKLAASFLVEPEVVPFPLVGQIAAIEPLSESSAKDVHGQKQLFSIPVTMSESTPGYTKSQSGSLQGQARSLDDLLERQKNAPLPKLYGERIEGEDVKGDRLRLGVSEVLDRGDQVTVLFSVVNTGKHTILLMTPQIQLGGKNRTGKVIKHERWSTAEQLPVADFRLSRRRVAVGERADGAVIFERPPYKQSNEQLFLQMAESGAVDRPALAPIAFGVSTVRQEEVNDK